MEDDAKDPDGTLSYDPQDPISLTDFKQDFLDGMHYTDIVDLQSYFISQSNMVNDLKHYLQHRSRKLNKQLSRGRLYGTDE